MVVLEFERAPTNQRLLIGWDSFGAWRGVARESTEKPLRVEQLVRWDRFPEGVSDQEFAQGLLAYAAEHRCRLMGLRSATVTHRGTQGACEATVLLGRLATRRPFEEMPPAIRAVLEELERIDMSLADRAIFRGRPPGGVGF